MLDDMTMEEEEVAEGVAGISFSDCWRKNWSPFFDKFSNSFTSVMPLPTIQYLPVAPLSTWYAFYFL